MTKSNTDKQLEHICESPKCRKPFFRRPGGRATCSRACSKALERSVKAPKPTKDQRRKAKFEETGTLNVMVRFSQRCGSVETYRGMTAEDLHEFAALVSTAKACRGWMQDGHQNDQYPICHVQQLNGTATVGLSYGSNVFIGLRKLNEQHGAKSVPHWAGRSIPRTSLRRRFLVTTETPKKVVVEKLCQLLGKELDRYLSMDGLVLKRTGQAEMARRIHNRIGTVRELNPLDRPYTLAELLETDFEKLQALEAQQTGQKTYVPDYAAKLPLNVLRSELQRFATTLPVGRHRENCVAMLPLVQVFCLWRAQYGYDSLIPNTSWKPFRYAYCDTELGEVEEDTGFSQSRIDALARSEATRLETATFIPTAYNMLQGLDVSSSFCRGVLRRRIKLSSIAPIPLVDEETDVLGMFTYVLEECRQYWSAMEALGLCTAQEVHYAPLQLAANMQSAVEHARFVWSKDCSRPPYPIPAIEELLSAAGVEYAPDEYAPGEYRQAA
ncbi:hypothetical protein IB256_09830 [Pseudomonas sp. PDM17]|uniref:hypothetical protein n=1 Tax=Pseudomonas sp. PDM17 TaxID=2769285 RepID=UPI001782615D|nr:hypothetical protein [Pseudomonas sp. PDM17]MBD9501077.1 hypothetical protein [Pseudomonas sp. PDM17]